MATIQCDVCGFFCEDQEKICPACKNKLRESAAINAAAKKSFTATEMTEQFRTVIKDVMDSEAKAQPAATNGSMTEQIKLAMKSALTIKSSFGEAVCEEGAGFVVSGGFIVTNAHVIQREKKVYPKIEAAFDGNIDSIVYQIAPVLILPDKDIAICKFRGLMDEKVKKQQHLLLEKSQPEVGERVFTIGNPFGVGLSVSSGVVSAENRQLKYLSCDSVIQTDISANVGNSGGALINSAGKVVGIISFIPDSASGGLSFAVTASEIESAIVKSVME